MVDCQHTKLIRCIVWMKWYFLLEGDRNLLYKENSVVKIHFFQRLDWKDDVETKIREKKILKQRWW